MTHTHKLILFEARFLFLTACRLLGEEPISMVHPTLGIFAHISLQNAPNLSGPEAHSFSLGFMSGLQLGQCKTLTFFWVGHCFIEMEVCFRSYSQPVGQMRHVMATPNPFNKWGESCNTSRKDMSLTPLFQLIERGNQSSFSGFWQRLEGFLPKLTDIQNCS